MKKYECLVSFFWFAEMFLWIVSLRAMLVSYPNWFAVYTVISGLILIGLSQIYIDAYKKMKGNRNE